MIASYPVNDYRGYLAHKSSLYSSGDAQGWQEAAQHKYYKREWVGKGWRYYYTKEEYDAAHGQRDAGRKGKEVQEYQKENKVGQQKSGMDMSSKQRAEGYEKVQALREQSATNAQRKQENAESQKGFVEKAADAIMSAPEAIRIFGEQQGQIYEIDPNGTEDDPIKRDENGKPVYANTIAGNTVRIATGIAEWATNAFNTVKSWITGLPQNLTKWFQDTKAAIKTKYDEAKTYVNGIIKQLKENEQVQAVVGAIRTGFDAVSTGAGAALRFIGSIPDMAATAFRSIAVGFGEIIGMEDQIRDALNMATSHSGHGGTF